MGDKPMAQAERLKDFQTVVDELRRRDALEPRTKRLYEILGTVWNAALETGSSDDGHGLNRALADTTRALAVQGKVFDAATVSLTALFAEDGSQECSQAPLGTEGGPPADAAFAVLSPDGTVTWHGVDAEKVVEETVAGAQPGALERRWLGPSCPLKVVASDVSALHPDDFAVNTLARRVIRGLSRGYIEQPWRGPVAVYAHDEGYAEVMPREWVERITRLAAG
jgi:hypothetical protein